MVKNKVFAGLGALIIQDYLKKERQLFELDQRILEFSGRIYTTPSLDLEKPMVDHSRVLDRMEKNSITLNALQQEKQWVQLELEEREREFQQVQKRMEPALWRHLQERMEKETVWDNSQAQEQKKEERLIIHSKELEEAYGCFWNLYQNIGRNDPLRMALLCRYVKRYYEELIRMGLRTHEEAEKEMEEVMGLSVRGIYRKIRLLYLEPEIRNWVAKGKISETAAYHLSFLKKSQQLLLISFAGQSKKRIRITPKMALTLRECTFKDWYHEEKIREILRN